MCNRVKDFFTKANICFLHQSPKTSFRSIILAQRYQCRLPVLKFRSLTAVAECLRQDATPFLQLQNAFGMMPLSFCNCRMPSA
jgi:hypothetical protein